ncbi:hypothetical protein ACOSQ3_014655 [Xanthoceras sorbifolium]
MVQYHVLGSLHCGFSFTDVAPEVILSKEKAYLDFLLTLYFLIKGKISGTVCIVSLSEEINIVVENFVSLAELIILISPSRFHL